MRALIYTEFTSISRYEKLLATLFAPLPEQPIELTINGKIESYLKNTYESLLRELNEKTTDKGFIYTLNRFVISTAEFGGNLSSLLKNEIQKKSIDYVYQSFWHGLFPVLSVLDDPKNTFRFEIEPIPPTTIGDFVGKMILGSSIGKNEHN